MDSGPAKGKLESSELILASGSSRRDSLQRNHEVLLFFPEVSHTAASDLLGMEIGLCHCLHRSFRWLPSHLASDQHYGPGPQVPMPLDPSYFSGRLPSPCPPAYWSSHPWIHQAPPATCSLCWEWLPQSSP